MSFGKGCKLNLIDGSAFIFRAYHALPPLTRGSDGLPIGAVAGFCNMLWKYIEDAKGHDAPTHAAVVFDYSSKTFRNDIYPEYKAQRPPPPEDLRPQFPLTRDATRAFNIAVLEVEDLEADDVIATLAHRARDAGGEVVIISSDKDLMQLVGGGVEMLDPIKNQRIGVEEVCAKFGLGPDKVVEIQALAGDSVDNIPGAPGIGIKTAATLISEWGDVETLLANADQIKQPKRRQSLIDNVEQIRVSRRLVELRCDADLDISLDDLEVRNLEADQLLEFLAEMELRTLARRVAERFDADLPQIETPRATPQATTTTPDWPAIDPSSATVISDAETLDAWIARIRDVGAVAIDTETTSLNEMQAKLVGISLCVGPGEAAYLPLGHISGHDGGGLFDESALSEGQMPMHEALDALRPVLEDPSIVKVLQNAKYDWKILTRSGIAMAPVEDTMLLSYALNAGRHNHGMDELSQTYLAHLCQPIKELIGAGKSRITFDRVPIATAAPYAAEDAEVTWRLWKMLRPRLSPARVTTVYETLERPLIEVLARMEMAGIRVDRDVLSRMSGVFAQKMAALEDEIHSLAGRSFNVASPKQLGEILFGEMALPGGKQGKTGAWSTSADVLEDLAAEGHDLPARILDWRQLSKLKSTYTDSLQTHIDPDTGRVHTSYSIAGASTGRLASTDPNLQNIPIRSEEGRRIREAFVAAEGHSLVALDYSQIELRILAHVADVPALKAAFREGQDIHALTASEMFGVPVEGMDPMIRRQAKAINFGVIYGISGFGLARNLRIPRDQAQAFINTYFERFPEIRTYMEETTRAAKAQGFVTTLFGRKIHTPGIDAKGPAAGGAKRAAINAPIQGTAADIIRRAMIRMEDAITDLPARMLLQVHDELVFEVKEGSEQHLINVARDVMVSAAMPIVALDVPLEVDAGIGANWAAAH